MVIFFFYIAAMVFGYYSEDEVSVLVFYLSWNCLHVYTSLYILSG